MSKFKDEFHERNNNDLVAGLRKMADFFEAHPAEPYQRIDQCIFIAEADDFREVARNIGDAVKGSDTAFVTLKKKFGDRVSVEWNLRHEKICERIVTTKIVPAEPEKIIPALPEREIEVVSWKCPESILAPERNAIMVEALASEHEQEQREAALHFQRDPEKIG